VTATPWVVEVPLGDDAEGYVLATCREAARCAQHRCAAPSALYAAADELAISRAAAGAARPRGELSYTVGRGRPPRSLSPCDIMTTTPHLDLPFIEGSPAQKHVTQNEALRILTPWCRSACAKPTAPRRRPRRPRATATRRHARPGRGGAARGHRAL